MIQPLQHLQEEPSSALEDGVLPAAPAQDACKEGGAGGLAPRGAGVGGAGAVAVGLHLDVEPPLGDLLMLVCGTLCETDWVHSGTAGRCR